VRQQLVVLGSVWSYFRKYSTGGRTLSVLRSNLLQGQAYTLMEDATT